MISCEFYPHKADAPHSVGPPFAHAHIIMLPFEQSTSSINPTRNTIVNRTAIYYASIVLLSTVPAEDRLRLIRHHLLPSFSYFVISTLLFPPDYACSAYVQCALAPLLPAVQRLLPSTPSDLCPSLPKLGLRRYLVLRQILLPRVIGGILRITPDHLPI